MMTRLELADGTFLWNLFGRMRRVVEFINAWLEAWWLIAAFSLSSTHYLLLWSIREIKQLDINVTSLR